MLQSETKPYICSSNTFVPEQPILEQTCLLEERGELFCGRDIAQPGPRAERHAKKKNAKQTKTVSEFIQYLAGMRHCMRQECNILI